MTPKPKAEVHLIPIELMEKLYQPKSPPSPPAEIAELIKFKRRRLFETQKEFGKRFSVGPRAVYQWEKGMRNPKAAAILFCLTGVCCKGCSKILLDFSRALAWK